MKKAKRILAIILAVTLCVALLASCNKSETPAASTSASPSVDPGAGSDAGSGAEPSTAPENPAPATGTPWANPDGSMNLDKIANYDPNFDYSQIEKHRIIYITESAPDSSTDRIDSGLRHWSGLMNIQYDGVVTANGDVDLFLTLIQTQIDQGYEGLVLDPSGLMMEAVADVMAGNPDVSWMTFNMSARAYDSSVPDDPGTLLHPFAGFDFIFNGQQSARGLLEWKESALPDVPWDRVGYIVIQNAEFGVFNLIQAGSDQIMRESQIPNENHFIADVAALSGSMTDAAQQAVSNIITTHDFDVWLISCLIENYAQGAAVTTTTLGITDTACIISTSASALIPQWQAGVETSWRLAWYTEPIMMVEPILGALYAFMNGWATPNTIWPSWVNINDCGEGRGGPYALFLVPAIYFTKDNYAQYLKWTDVYSGRNDYPDFSGDGITRDSFDVEVPIPDYYNILGG